MRNFILFATAGLLVFAGGLAWAQKASVNSRQPTPVGLSVKSLAANSSFATVSNLIATPSIIPFTANNPGSVVAGGSTATVAWNITGGKSGQTWTLSVGTSSSSFSGCTTVPESAVKVKCASASVSGGGQVSAGCNVSSFTTLPNTLPGLQVASGNEGNASSHSYTVVLSYEMADSWSYIAKTCPLTITYTMSP